MKLDFDLGHVRTTEFGVGRDVGDKQTFVLVPVDGDVQEALQEIAEATKAAMQEETTDPHKYQPSEKYAGSEYAYLPLDDPLAKLMRELHQVDNLTIDAKALEEPSEVFCYFARMTDNQGRRLTALRRATQFKGVLKSRLIRVVTDALKLIEDRVFKLDTDFDVLVDSTTVHILRPSGFEFANQLQVAVLAAVPVNVKAIRHDLPFIEFATIQEYAGRHPRAARYLSSIRTQRIRNMDKGALKRLCQANGVVIRDSKGTIKVAEEHVMGFLEVLDRRRYEVELIPGSPERFRAASRHEVTK